MIKKNISREKFYSNTKHLFYLLVFLFLLCPLLVKAEWKNIGNVSRVVEQKSNYVILQTTSGAKVRVEFFDTNVVRVRVAPKGIFERNFSYAIDYAQDRKTPTVKFSQTAKEIVLTNYENQKVVVGKMPFSISVFDANGEAIAADDKNQSVSFDTATGEIKNVKLRRGETETYYGFGEKSFAGMSRHGQYIVNWNTDTFAYPQGLDPIYQTIPFFYALRAGKAYGVFFNNTFRSFFDMGKTSPAKYSFGADGGELDYFVFTGGRERSPKKILEDYANLTGKTPLPPLWALGNQQSRWSYSPESRVREIADNFRRRKIPCDVIYLDIDYMNGYRVFTWDKTRFPNPQKLVSDLANDGFKTVLIIDPGIKADENYSVYTDGKQQGIFVKNPSGTEFNASVWAGNSAFPDFTNPKAREWFGNQYKNNIAEGVAGFWNDMNEPATFLNDQSDKPQIYHHPGKTFPVDTPHFGDGLPDTHRRYHNVYGMQMARSTFEGEKRLRPEKRPFVLTRAGFSGVQRFSAIWTGDNVASWDHLALTIPMLTNLSVSGVPFVGADVGGFAGMPSGELYARWLEAAAFTPFFRSHSEISQPNKEPWEYGSDYEKINRATIEMRYQFLPYLYTQFYEHEKTGAPVMRPLWFEYPSDQDSYLNDDEYLVGRDLLVAPVVREGQRKRNVYFPKGDDWRDWQTGEIYKGGSNVEVSAPIEKLPLFVRVGAVIPTQPVIQNTTEMPRVNLTLNVAAGIAPGKVETSKIFQDEGDGYGYKSSNWRDIRIEHRQGVLRITRSGDFQGQKIKFLQIIGIEKRPSEMRVDGKVIKDSDFDEKSKRLKIELPDNAAEITLVR